MGNKTDKKGYIISFLFTGVITIGIFLWKMPKYELNVGKLNISSYVFFFLLNMVAVTIGMGISIKRERNLFNVIMCWLIPTIVYLDAFFWRSEVFWYIIALVIILGNVFLVGICKKMKKSAIPGDARYLMLVKKLDM